VCVCACVCADERARVCGNWKLKNSSRSGSRGKNAPSKLNERDNGGGGGGRAKVFAHLETTIE